MEVSQLKDLERWFDSYVAGTYGSDERINANLKLKEDHSKRTESEMEYLAQSLKMDAGGVALAKAVGLLHDIGRFEQFNAYQTYNDGRSTNHGRLGLKVLREHCVLAGIDQAEMSIIEAAVEYHCVHEVPALTGNRLKFTKLVRDADKIDIFEVAIAAYKDFKANPEKFKLEIEYPLSGGCSPEVLAMVAGGKTVEYKLLKTMDDVRLMQIGWVYDINFAAALVRIRQRGYLDELASMLPDRPEIKTVVASVFAYVDERINKGQ